MSDPLPISASRECGQGALQTQGSGGLAADRPLPDNHGVTPDPAPDAAHPDAAQEPGSCLPRATAQQIAEAHRRLGLIQEYTALQTSGLIPARAADVIRRAGFAVSRATLDRWAGRYAAAGLDGLIDGRQRSGRRRTVLTLTPEEHAAIRGAVLTTNRTADSGSVPEAMRLAARTGQLRPETAGEIEARLRDGARIPDALRRELIPAPAVVRQHRNPTDAGLDYLSAPGTTMWVRDRRTGEDRFCRVGDVLEADDASINLYVCVPWEIGGCPASERWGVKVGRFQWLVAIDRASRYVPGWSYTMRPRDSYRAEDIVGLFHGIFRQHGVWERLCLEQGAWKSHQVTALLEQLRIERMTAWSPHQKPYIEGLFSSMWTKLSDLPGQIGRHRGEEEEAAAIARSCQRGATDPRLHFPMLADVLAALHRVTAERNAQRVESENYGAWIPEERWLAQQAEARETGRLRPLPAGAAWMFAPCSREWTVQGGTVGGSIQVMEGLSVRYDFAAEWLTEFSGARVRAHFDSAAPTGQSDATLVLLDNVRDHRAGEVLGTAAQVNKTARYARRALGWGDDPDTGRDMRRVQAQALRAEVRTILPGGRPGVATSTARDGLGRAITIESTPGATATPTEPAPTAPAPATRRGANPFRSASPAEHARSAARTAALLAALPTE